MGKIKIPMGAVATPCRPARTMRVHKRAMAASEVTSEAKPEETKPKEVPEGKAKIYVGKGRYIVDDPAKYPDKTTFTGGFAGGEVMIILKTVPMVPILQ